MKKLLRKILSASLCICLCLNYVSMAVADSSAQQENGVVNDQPGSDYVYAQSATELSFSSLSELETICAGNYTDPTTATFVGAKGAVLTLERNLTIPQNLTISMATTIDNVSQEYGIVVPAGKTLTIIGQLTVMRITVDGTLEVLGNQAGKSLSVTESINISGVMNLSGSASIAMSEWNPALMDSIVYGEGANLVIMPSQSFNITSPFTIPSGASVSFCSFTDTYVITVAIGEMVTVNAQASLSIQDIIFQVEGNTLNNGNIHLQNTSYRNAAKISFVGSYLGNGRISVLNMSGSADFDPDSRLEGLDLNGFERHDSSDSVSWLYERKSDSNLIASGTLGNLSWTLDTEGSLIISGNGAIYDFTYDNASAWLLYRSKIIAVTINPGVTSIGNYAFSYCNYLTSITIPSGVESIGDNAFVNCSNLASITIPSGVQRIGSNAFTSCRKLMNITIPSSLTEIGIDAFTYCRFKTAGPIGSGCDYQFGWENYIPGNAFRNCLLLTSATIPSGVTSIGYAAFANCLSLTSIILPSGVESIERLAFLDCSDLTSIVIPSSVTFIYDNAFADSGLTDVYYDGTQTQWDTISIATNNDPLLNATLHIQGESQITPPVAFLYAPDATKEFDGDPLVMDPGTATSVITDSEGRNFKAVIEYAGGSITNIGSIENSVTSYALYDMNDTLLFSQAELANYPNFRVVNGTLTVAEPTYKAPLTVRGVSTTVTATQQGQVFYASELGGELGYTNGYQVEGLLSGHEISGSNIVTGNGNASFTATVHQNAIRVIRTSDGQDVTPLYDIQTIDGSVTVIPYEQGEQPSIDTGSGISVVESTGDPVITSFKFYQDVDGTEYVELTDMTDTLTVNYNGTADPYKFVVTVDRPELINHIYVTGDAPDGIRKMEANYDAAINAFVSTGYFDADDVYFQPENIKLEYSVKTTTPEVGNPLNWDEMMPYLGSLNNANVSIAQTGSTNAGTIDFSGTVDKLNNIALNYSIKTLDASLGTEFGALRSYYQTGENILSYVVPGLNDSKYYAYLDFSDPLTYKMLIDDGLNVGSKIIELEMTFMDTESSQFIAYGDMAETFGDVALITKVVGDTYKICKENADLRQEIVESTTIEDKNEALKKADDYKYDKIAFMLLTTALPIIVAASPVGVAPAMLFTAMIKVVAAASDVLYDYRVAGILGKAVNAEWFKGLQVGLAKCGEHAFMKITPDGHLKVYGTGDTYDFEAYNHPLYLQSPFKSTPIYKITVGNGITGLGKNLFYDRVYLTDVTIADSVDYIGVQCFKYCKNLEELRLPTSLQTIDTEAFSCSGLRHISFPSSLKEIGDNAFSTCTLLEEIEIPNSVANIGAAAFQGCDSLAKAVLPNSVTSVSNGLFYNCINLAEIQLPEQITEIGEYAFYYCKRLGTINLDNVTTIGPHAFDTCWELTGILSLKNVDNLGESAFSECRNINGVIFSNELKEIPEHTFDDCWQLSKLVLPESLTTIGKYAFDDCSSLGPGIIVIPSSVTHIADCAFGMSYIDERDYRIFYFTGPAPTMNQCFLKNYASIYYPTNKGWTADDRYDYGESVEWIPGDPVLGTCEFTLPADTQYIMDSAFEEVSARSIFVPDGCISIGENAFKGSKLSKIRIPGMCSIATTAFDDCGYVLVYSERGSNVEQYCESHHNCIFLSE